MDVNQEIAAFRALREEVTRAEDHLKQLKGRREQVSNEIGVHLGYSVVEEGQRWAQDLYWSDSDMAGLVSDAYKGVFGGRFVPVVRQMEIDCESCGTKAIVPCSSWTDYKQKVARGRWHEGFICSGCVERRQIEARRRTDAARRAEVEKHIESIVVGDDDGRLYLEHLRQMPDEERQRLRQMPYDEYLQTEHWRQHLRPYALKLAGGRCQLCNGGGELHVHHRTYERRGYEDIKDVIVLCKKCHEKHHDITAD